MNPTLARTPTLEAVIKSGGLDCSYIMLGHGRFALIDHDDFAVQSGWVWHLNLRGYAARLKGRKIIYLHRTIMGDIKGVAYDHINRNKLDCRRSNLRLADKHQNAGNANIRNQIRPKTSKFKGVCFDSGKHRWLAQGRNRGRMVFLGRFKDETLAAMAYDDWASKHFGIFASHNQVSQRPE
jgi:hypothetical protein